jgi:DNA polymerase
MQRDLLRQSGMNRQKQLQDIADEIEHCPLCRQCGTGKAVPGEGTGDASIMFIGEAPGREEARTGRPFVGRSGRFLREMIQNIGMNQDSVFITSPVYYLPFAGKPTAVMIEHGRTHLLKQIAVLKPRLLVLLGSTACRALLQKNVEIAKEHGNVVEKDGISHFITFHPAYAFRFPEGKKKFIQDLAALKELMERLF